MFVPTPDEKRQVIPEVFYEIRQLANATYMEQLGIFARPIYFLLLEARLLHERKLIDFFEGKAAKRSRKTDVILAIDYGFQYKPLSLDSSYKNRLNRALAHLSYARAKAGYHARSWPNENALKILIRSQEFTQYVLANYLPSEHQDQMPNAKKLVGDIAHVIALLEANL
jgi:hypothetical protein